jgi:hypothetical protein
MSILAGVGTAGVPGGSIPLIVIVLQSVGIPAEGIGIILGVDRFLDMCRTTLNVTGDLVCATVVARSEGLRFREAVPRSRPGMKAWRASRRPAVMSLGSIVYSCIRTGGARCATDPGLSPGRAGADRRQPWQRPLSRGSASSTSWQLAMKAETASSRAPRVDFESAVEGRSAWAVGKGGGSAQTLVVRSGRFATQKLKVAPAYVEPPESERERIVEDKAKVARVWAEADTPRRWDRVSQMPFRICAGVDLAAPPRERDRSTRARRGRARRASTPAGP